jgi:hypothetical protein
MDLPRRDAPSLPPERPDKRRRVVRTGCILTAIGVLVCGGCLQGVLYWAVPPHTWKGWVDDERKTPPPWHVEVPTPNARDDYDTAVALLPTSESQTTLVEQWARARRSEYPVAAESSLPDIEALVTTHRGVLDALARGADKRFASGKPASPGAVFPEISKYRMGVRLATAAAHAAHVRGNDDEALHLLADAASVGVNVNSGESPIQTVIGAACVASEHGMAVEIISDGHPSDGALRAHARRMRELRGRLPGMAGTLTYEAAFTDAALDLVARGGLTSPSQTEADLGIPKLTLALARLKLGGTREWLRDRYARLIEEVDKPVAESHYQELSDRTEDDLAARDDHLGQVIMPIYGKAVATYRAMVARLAAQEIIAALELYRRERGRLPVGLAELVPAYLPDVPGDPFTDGPMGYRLTSTGYKLYAFGPNRTDDGGVSDKPGTMEPDLVLAP